MAQIPQADHDELHAAIEACHIVDNHAHNIARLDRQDNLNLLSIFTEASGDALRDTPRSLAFLRGIKQLRELYGAPSNATWADLLKLRAELNQDELTRKCLAGTHSILIDDGFDDAANVQPVRWHDQFTTGKNRRIVRIETLASDIMKVLYEDGDAPLRSLEGAIDLFTVWPIFLQAFENAIADEIRDGNVAGFKSVICYRTGLGVTISDEQSMAAAGQDAFRSYLRACSRGRYRLQDKGLNDCLVVSTCRLISAHYQQTGISKPFQFHTGLGDNDISLLMSNPALLQPLIATFTQVNFVLLHSSYPYTREAGYLTTVYPNTYLDLGEIFPMVSIQGQISAIKQAMELSPLSKLLWSTDGHHFPESYWLANRQFKLVLGRVLGDLLAEEVITKGEAIRAARDILFENANWLYNLKLERSDKRESTIDKSLPLLPAIFGDLASSAAPLPPTAVSGKVPAATGRQHQEVSHVYDHKALATYLRTTHGKATTYFIVQWIDWLGTIRSRSLPLKSFERLIRNEARISITAGSLHVLQDDSLTPACNTAAQLLVQPDLNTIRPAHPKDLRGATTVLSSFLTDRLLPSMQCPRSLLQSLSDRLARDHNLYILVGFELEFTLLKPPVSPDGTAFTASEGDDTAHAWGTLTPQQATTSWPIIVKMVDELTQLGFTVEQFHAESGAGQYELSFAPLPLVAAVDVMYQARQAIQLNAQRHGLRATLHPCPLGTFGSGMHAHVSLNRFRGKHVPSDTAVDHLPATAPATAQAESAPSPPVSAAADLSNAPEVSASDAATPSPDVASTTIPVDTPQPDQPQPTPPPQSPSPEPRFWAGVLRSLRPICAFTLPSEDSYARVADDRWAGGSWVAWGTENRETPLRRIWGRDVGRECGAQQQRWEVRCLDGMGNACLALAAVVGAGMAGLEGAVELEMRDCTGMLPLPQGGEMCADERRAVNPARMTEGQRADANITEKLPRSLAEALVALEGSEVLKSALGEGLVADYLVVKRAEQEKLAGAMSEEERRAWLIRRY